MNKDMTGHAVVEPSEMITTDRLVSFWKAFFWWAWSCLLRTVYAGR